MPPKLISTRSVYKNPHAEIMVDEVELNGTRWEQVYVTKTNRDGVAILPVVGDSVYMVRQYRYPIHESIWQFPMGGVEKGQSAEQAARQELEEETGITHATLVKLGTFKPDPGMTSAHMHVYLATDFTVGTAHREKTESDMEVQKIKLTALPSMIEAGTANCGYTMSVYLLYALYRKSKHETR